MPPGNDIDGHSQARGAKRTHSDGVGEDCERSRKRPRLSDPSESRHSITETVPIPDEQPTEMESSRTPGTDTGDEDIMDSTTVESMLQDSEEEGRDVLEDYEDENQQFLPSELAQAAPRTIGKLEIKPKGSADKINPPFFGKGAHRRRLVRPLVYTKA